MPYTLQFQKSDVLASTLLTGATSTTLTSSAFGSPTGTQLYVVDYDVPAKAEVISAVISSNAVSSVTRGLDNTSNQDHQIGAKIASIFVPSHYTQLGPLASSDAWTAWSPSPTGFSGSASVGVARYFQVGKMVWCRLEIDGTSNATTFTFTLPVAAKNSGRAVSISVYDNGSWQGSSGNITLTSASTTATVSKDSAGTGFTATGGKGLEGSFFYEAA